MPLFYFILKAGRHAYPDCEGQEFADVTDARAHAHAVARDLMRNRETKTGHWRVQVCDDYLEPCYECLFAEVDDTLQGYAGDLRTAVTLAARTTAAMGDAIREIDAAMTDLRQTLNRIDFIVSSRRLA